MNVCHVFHLGDVMVLFGAIGILQRQRIIGDKYFSIWKNSVGFI